MAAYVVCPNEQQWEVLQWFLGQAREGCILVAPEARQQIKEKHGFDPDEIEGQPIAYDFGGEPDVWLDVVRGPDNFGVAAMRKAVGQDPDSDDDNES